MMIRFETYTLKHYPKLCAAEQLVSDIGHPCASNNTQITISQHTAFLTQMMQDRHGSRKTA